MGNRNCSVDIQEAAPGVIPIATRDHFSLIINVYWEKEEHMKAFGKFLAGFLLGGILGSLLALLLAPVSGSELRGRIENNFSRVRTEVESAAKQRSEELKRELARLQKKDAT